MCKYDLWLACGSVVELSLFLLTHRSLGFCHCPVVKKAGTPLGPTQNHCSSVSRRVRQGKAPYLGCLKAGNDYWKRRHSSGMTEHPGGQGQSPQDV